jgi:GTPase SAR1 family protein
MGGGEFSVKVVVVPDASRGKSNLLASLLKKDV